MDYNLNHISSGLMAEAMPIIEDIARHKTNQCFAYYEQDDIDQEIRLICIRALPSYSPSKGRLKNYLARCVSNRLNNLKRDKYFRPNKNDPTKQADIQSRIKIVNPISLFDSAGRNIHDVNYGDKPCLAMEYQELIDRLLLDLSPSYVIDFKIMMSGSGYITDQRAYVLKKEIMRLMDSYRHE